MTDQNTKPQITTVPLSESEVDPGSESLDISSPALKDSLDFSGSMPDPASDDDIDEVGKDYGVHYNPDEPLQMKKKIPFQTPVVPPEK